MSTIFLVYAGVILVSILVSFVSLLRKRESKKTFLCTVFFGFIGIWAVLALTGERIF